MRVDEYGMPLASPSMGTRPEPEDLEPELGTHLLEELHGAVPPVAEVEVGTDDDESRREALDEHLADELLGRLAAARLVEGEDAREVDEPGRGDELELLVEHRQHLRRALGTHDLGRMTVEGEARGRETPRVGEVAHEAQHGLVPEVHAVVRADRHDRARGRAA